MQEGTLPSAAVKGLASEARGDISPLSWEGHAGRKHMHRPRLADVAGRHPAAAGSCEVQLRSPALFGRGTEASGGWGPAPRKPPDVIVHLTPAVTSASPPLLHRHQTPCLDSPGGSVCARVCVWGGGGSGCGRRECGGCACLVTVGRVAHRLQGRLDPLLVLIHVTQEVCSPVTIFLCKC